jgi:hypothetical protein
VPPGHLHALVDQDAGVVVPQVVEAQRQPDLCSSGREHPAKGVAVVVRQVRFVFLALVVRCDLDGAELSPDAVVLKPSSASRLSRASFFTRREAWNSSQILRVRSTRIGPRDDWTYRNVPIQKLTPALSLVVRLSSEMDRKSGGRTHAFRRAGLSRCSSALASRCRPRRGSW